MKLNGTPVKIDLLKHHQLDGKIIFYDENNSRVSVLNGSASDVFNIILNAYERNIDIDSSSIFDDMKKKYNLPLERFEEVKNDIEDTINSFFELNILN